ncbi:MAG: recombinase family protein, partial [Acidobacteria bacterium]|nr:recombinase family protein [Acidobacteriota bacterium]
MCASGLSLKSIAKKLNSEGIPPPRPRAGKQYGTWCPTAIHAMLRRELYIGQVIWNRSRFIKAPGSNKRLRRARPYGEWRVSDRPELRIISRELWQRVHERLVWVKEAYGRTQHEGLFSRAASSPCLLTGFLKCGICGANLVIVAGRGKSGHRKYGCPQNFYRGACPNTLKERQDRLEKQLFAGLQNAVLRPEAIDYAVQQFGRQLQTALNGLSSELARMRGRKEHLEAELQRLVAAVAEGGHSAFLLEAIGTREGELREIGDRLLSADPESVPSQLENIRRFITTRLADLRALLYTDVERARFELGKHITEIRMLPESSGKDSHYAATGVWDLLSGYAEGPEKGNRVRLVAGVGFEPT